MRHARRRAPRARSRAWARTVAMSSRISTAKRRPSPVTSNRRYGRCHKPMQVSASTRQRSHTIVAPNSAMTPTMRSAPPAASSALASVGRHRQPLDDGFAGGTRQRYRKARPEHRGRHREREEQPEADPQTASEPREHTDRHHDHAKREPIGHQHHHHRWQRGERHGGRMHERLSPPAHPGTCSSRRPCTCSRCVAKSAKRWGSCVAITVTRSALSRSSRARTRAMPVRS